MNNKIKEYLDFTKEEKTGNINRSIEKRISLFRRNGDAQELIKKLNLTDNDVIDIEAYLWKEIQGGFPYDDVFNSDYDYYWWAFLMAKNTGKNWLIMEWMIKRMMENPFVNHMVCKWSVSSQQSSIVTTLHQVLFKIFLVTGSDLSPYFRFSISDSAIIFNLPGYQKHQKIFLLAIDNEQRAQGITPDVGQIEMVHFDEVLELKSRNATLDNLNKLMEKIELITDSAFDRGLKVSEIIKMVDDKEMIKKLKKHVIKPKVIFTLNPLANIKHELVQMIMDGAPQDKSLLNKKTGYYFQITKDKKWNDDLGKIVFYASKFINPYLSKQAKKRAAIRKKNNKRMYEAIDLGWLDSMSGEGFGEDLKFIHKIPFDDWVDVYGKPDGYAGGIDWAKSARHDTEAFIVAFKFDPSINLNRWIILDNISFAGKDGIDSLVKKNEIRQFFLKGKEKFNYQQLQVAVDNQTASLVDDMNFKSSFNKDNFNFWDALKDDTIIRFRNIHGKIVLGTISIVPTLYDNLIVELMGITIDDNGKPKGKDHKYDAVMYPINLVEGIEEKQ